MGLAMLAPSWARAQLAEPLHAGDMAQIRAAFKGRPMLLHVWSLTCAPCLIEMPKWAERIRKNPGVAFVFINTDGMRHAAAATRRLASSGVKPARSLVYADDFVERLQYDIAPDWLGELPRTEGVSGTGSSWVTLGPVSDGSFRQWLARAR
jgi:thiol-disulfide isomerase/thioredoxin